MRWPALRRQNAPTRGLSMNRAPIVGIFLLPLLIPNSSIHAAGLIAPVGEILETTVIETPEAVDENLDAARYQFEVDQRWFAEKFLLFAKYKQDQARIFDLANNSMADAEACTRTMWELGDEK